MKIAVVTGASSGIGRSAAGLLASRGFGVVLTYNSNEEGAREAVAEIESAGGEALALPLDLARSETFPAFAEELAAAVDRRWGRTGIDCLVNNAGFGGYSPFADTAEETYERFHRALLKGPYFLTQRLLPMIAEGGAIVNTGSNSARPQSVEAGYSAYATMKGGLNTMSRYLAKELAPRGIRVNVVSPGPTRTGMSSDAFDQNPEILEDLIGRTALRRVGMPEDVAKVIAVLASDEGAWITGEEIEVSGGFNL